MIENAAKTEIDDLAKVLNAMGARIQGAGTDIIQIDGVKSLGGVTHRIIPDRIEAGSFVIAAALTGGDVFVKGARADHLEAFLIKLKEAGVSFSANGEGIRVQQNGKIKSVDVKTLPYRISRRPAGANDGVDEIADGISVITETILRIAMHVQELDRMGRKKLEGSRAIGARARAVGRAGDGERRAPAWHWC